MLAAYLASTSTVQTDNFDARLSRLLLCCGIHSAQSHAARHIKIQEQFRAHQIDQVKIPSCHLHLCAANGDVQFPACLLVTERIQRLPLAIRDLLVGKYCSGDKAEAKAYPANKDCLARTYLGSPKSQSSSGFFWLRNFELHLDQMLELKLDIKDIARRMAMALAAMHWAAKTDARDVEFILGSSMKNDDDEQVNDEQVGKLIADQDDERFEDWVLLEDLGLDDEDSLGEDEQDDELGQEKQPAGRPSSGTDNFLFQYTELWVLDFDQVQDIELNKDGR